MASFISDLGTSVGLIEIWC